MEPGDTQPKLPFEKSKQETYYLKLPKNFIDFTALFNYQNGTIAFDKGIEIGRDRWTRENHTLLIDGLMGHDLIVNVILLYFFD